MTHNTSTIEHLEPRQLLAAGDIVRSFGTGGVVSIPHLGPASELVVQKDGRFLVSTGDRILRFKPNGRLDKSFASRGTLRAGGGSFALDDRGRILLTGIGVASTQWGFRRFNPDGTPDTSLNGNGVASARIGDDHDEGASRIAVAPDGKIVLAGFQDNDIDDPDVWLDRAGHDIAVARFNPDGTVDTTFAQAGEYITNRFERLNTLAVGPQGNILIGGQWNSGSTIHGAVNEEIGPDGQLIDGTDTGGFTGFVFGEEHSVAYRPDGLAVGAATGPGTSLVWRSDDVPYAIVNAHPTDSSVVADNMVNDVITTPDNKTYVAGFTGYGGGVPRSGIMRLTPDHKPDPTFGFGGAAAFNFGRRKLDMFDQIDLLPNGDVIAAGAVDFRKEFPPSSSGGRLFLTRIQGGSNEVGKQRPRAEAHPNAPTAGQAEYQFRVTYAAERSFDQSTLGDRDVRLLGPDGYRPYARLVSVEERDRGDARALVATYAVPAPGGSWDSADNGRYTVVLRRRAVRDNFGNPAPAGIIGSIDVNLTAAGTTQSFSASRPVPRSFFSETRVTEEIFG